MHRPGLIGRLAGDERGASTVFMAVSLSAVLGIVAVGLNAAAGFQAKGRLQAAADAAAHGGALAIKTGGNPVAMAKALVLENLAGEPVDVAVEWPPASGNEAGNPAAVRVTLSEDRPVLLASLLGHDTLVVRSSATARLDKLGPACLLALGPAGSLDKGGAGQLQLSGCLALSAEDGVSPARLAELDPYRLNLAPPPCTPGKLSITAPTHFAAGALLPYPCGGIEVKAGGSLSLATPVIHLTGPLVVEAGGSLTTTGTTLAVGQNAVRFEPGSSIQLKPPAAGPTAGIILLGQAGGPETLSRLLAGKAQSLTGAILLPAQQVEVAGNEASCTQVIARRITIGGATAMEHSCSGLGTRPIALQTALLVE